MSSSPFAIRLEKQSDELIVLFVAGEIDMATSPQLLEAITSGALMRPRDLVVDAADVTHIDSMGLRALLNALTVTKEQDVNLKLRNPS